MVLSLSSQNDCGIATSCMIASAGIDDSGIVGDLSMGFVYVMLISCCMSMLQKAKIPMTTGSWGFNWFWGNCVQQNTDVLSNQFDYVLSK